MKNHIPLHGEDETMLVFGTRIPQSISEIIDAMARRTCRTRSDIGRSLIIAQLQSTGLAPPLSVENFRASA